VAAAVGGSRWSGTGVGGQEPGIRLRAPRPLWLNAEMQPSAHRP